MAPLPVEMQIRGSDVAPWQARHVCSMNRAGRSTRSSHSRGASASTNTDIGAKASAPAVVGAVPATRFNAPRPASAACELREIAQTSRRDASRNNVYAPPHVMPHARAPHHPSAGRRWSAGVGSRCARCVRRAEARELLRDGGWAQQHRPATRRQLDAVVQTHRSGAPSQPKHHRLRRCMQNYARSDRPQ